MTTGSSADSSRNDGSEAAAPPADMQEADTANGENPVEMNDAGSSTAGPPDTPSSQPTGEQQARENAEDDPPA